MIKFINFLFFLLILNACDSKSCDTKNNGSDNQNNSNNNDIQPPPTDPDTIAKADAKAQANALVADNTIVVDAEKVQNTITDAAKKKEITKSIKEINTLKDEINTAISNANTDVAALEDLSSKLKSKTESLIILKNTAAAGLITPEQTQAKKSPQIVADSAEEELNKAKNILNKGTLSDSKDLDSKQQVLGQALVDFKNLSATASADDIKAAQKNIVNALNALNQAKAAFDTAEVAAEEKAKKEVQDKAAAEAAKKNNVAIKKDFPYTLLTLQGDASELESSIKQIYPHYPKQNIMNTSLYSSADNKQILIKKTNRPYEFYIYYFDTETSEKILFNDEKLDNFSYFKNSQLLNNKNTPNIKEKIQEKAIKNAAVIDVEILNNINKILFVTYIQFGNKYLNTCSINDVSDEIIACNNPILLGSTNYTKDVMISIANDKKSAFISTGEKNIYYSNDSFIEITSNNMTATKDNPLAVTSVDGLDPQHICTNVFNNNIPITAATKIADIWYVIVSTKVVKNTATDGVYKICKIKEEVINP